MPRKTTIYTRCRLHENCDLEIGLTDSIGERINLVPKWLTDFSSEVNLQGRFIQTIAHRMKSGTLDVELLLHDQTLREQSKAISIQLDNLWVEMNFSARKRRRWARKRKRQLKRVSRG